MLRGGRLMKEAEELSALVAENHELKAENEELVSAKVCSPQSTSTLPSPTHRYLVLFVPTLNAEGAVGGGVL